MSDTEDPWGRDEPPAVAEGELEPLPPALAEIERMLEYGEDRPLAPGERLSLPGPADLPEVAAFAAEGFEPLPNGLMGSDSAFLPAIWPREHRRWVRDRMPKFGLVSFGEDDLVLGPEMGGDTHQLWLLAREARSLGMAPPPRDRLWLLRSPWPSLRVSSLRLLFAQHRDRSRMGWDTTALMRAAQDLLPRPESELWSLWTGHQADAARAWRDAGRLGAESDTWVKLGLAPHHLEVLAAPMAEGGAGLDPAQTRAWCEIVCMLEQPGDEAVQRIVAWRQAGLPADAPVERLGMVLLDRTPADLAPWLAAGLTVEDIAVWQAEDIERARRWHEAGFPARDVRRLRDADPALTPEEARAFDAAGITHSERVRWVSAGFSAEEARAWTDIDVVASEARVWRAEHRGIEEARAQRAAGGDALPMGVELGWAATGPERDDANYGVIDPPGTRGSAAQSGPPPFDLP
ncbi:hypothetical protein [Terrabacter sp. 2RAF25]|uniref:hypothetical protein n=1 Tax=Terrabacter sp. 2RAF25 TaxID=3232998 RepID=UPI003F9B1310